MNYLIVIPRVVNKVDDFYLFPIGIAYISSVMVNAGLNVYKLNLNHIDLPVYDALGKAINSYKIDVVLTGGLTGQYGAIRAVIESAKKVKENIVTVVGGGIITSSPLYAMQALESADYGVIGEGEVIVLDLCNAMEAGQSIKDVAGIAYRDGATFNITEGTPELVDINRIPIPDYDGLGVKELLKTVPNIIGMSEYNTFPIITSRGCPFKCTFCFHPSGQKYRPRSLDDVFSEIDYLVGKYNIKYLSILDELFSNNIARVREFCVRIKPYNIKWWAEFRVSAVTPELVKMLKDANCASMAFGIESADNRILKSMNKKITVEQTNRALEIVYSAGIAMAGCLIFGDIAETFETATNTINWWKEHIHYGLQLSLVVTYPGTALFQYALEKGLIKDPVQFIRDSCPTVKLSKMTAEEYAWIMEQILGLQRMPGSLPRRIISLLIDYQQASMELTATCSSCDSVNTWQNIRFFISESLTCKDCGRRHYSPVPDAVADRISNSLDKLLNRHEKICLWGVNSFFFALSEKINSLDNSRIVCVDKSEIRHGINILGGKLKPTEVIKTEGIRCIIVTVPQYYSSLAPMIQREFSEVERIISISELLSDKFV